jgi:hypothetical protein
MKTDENADEAVEILHLYHRMRIRPRTWLQGERPFLPVSTAARKRAASSK